MLKKQETNRTIPSRHLAHGSEPIRENKWPIHPREEGTNVDPNIESVLKHARTAWVEEKYADAWAAYESLQSKGIPEAHFEFALLMCQKPNEVGPIGTHDITQSVLHALHDAESLSSEKLWSLIYKNVHAHRHAENFLPIISQSICEHFSRKNIDEVVYYYLLDKGYEKNSNTRIVALVDEMCAQGRIPAALKAETVLAIAAAIEATLQGRGHRVSEHVLLTPAYPPAEVSIPSEPPALWDTARQGRETPVEFINRHYQPWIGKGLTRPDIKRLDPKLYAALTLWLYRHPGDAENLNLPTKSEATTWRLLRVVNDRQRLRGGLHHQVSTGAPETGWRGQIAAERGLVPLIELGRDDPAAAEERLAIAVSDAPAAPQRPAAPPPPDTAPELYRARSVRDPKTGRLEGVHKFIARVYAPWIVDGELLIPRKTIRELDPECAFAITRWQNNHKGEPFPIKLGEEETDVALTPEQVRAAQRIAKRAYRERKAAMIER